MFQYFMKLMVSWKVGEPALKTRIQLHLQQKLKVLNITSSILLLVIHAFTEVTEEKKNTTKNVHFTAY